jgi:hypothetical protein
VCRVGSRAQGLCCASQLRRLGVTVRSVVYDSDEAAHDKRGLWFRGLRETRDKELEAVIQQARVDSMPVWPGYDM